MVTALIAIAAWSGIDYAAAEMEQQLNGVSTQISQMTGTSYNSVYNPSW